MAFSGRKLFYSIGLLLAAHCTAWCQTPSHIMLGYTEEIDAKQVKLWKSVNLSEYTGSYGFGESEAEWELIVLQVDSFLTFQAISHYWGKDAKSFLRKVENFKKVPVQNGRFHVGDLTGYFAVYMEDGKSRKGIVLTGKIVNATSSKDSGEFGPKDPYDLNETFSGKYPQLSYKIIDDAWLKSQSKDDLQLMRNEILARYGMRFQQGGKMFNYFSKQEWYVPQHDNVLTLLTEIEKRNLEKIQRIEKNNP
jgi:hypothetical protein